MAKRSKKEKLSAGKLLLGAMTGGSSLLLTGIRKKTKKTKSITPAYRPTTKSPKIQSTQNKIKTNNTVKNRFADSSSIPPDEIKYYQSDEYYQYQPFGDFGSTVIDFSARIKTTTPSASGLYPPEILLLYFCKKYPQPKGGYPGYWWFKYGIRNVGDVLEILLEREFLMLDETTRKYKLTDKGKEELSNNEHIVWAHNSGKNVDGISAWTISDILKQAQKQTNSSNWRDNIWWYMNNYCVSNKPIGFLRNMHLQMAYFAEYEKNYKAALLQIDIVLNYDKLDGFEYPGIIDLRNRYTKKLEENGG